MTSKQAFEGMLIELSKVHASPMLIEDFNYFINRAQYQYINKRYNIYDTNQQTTDDLRVLTSSVALTPKLADENSNSLYTIGTSPINLYQATYQVELPTDYFHTLNCICAYKVNTLFKCYNPGNIGYNQRHMGAFKTRRISKCRVLVLIMLNGLCYSIA